MVKAAGVKGGVSGSTYSLPARPSVPGPACTDPGAYYSVLTELRSASLELEALPVVVVSAPGPVARTA